MSTINTKKITLNAIMIAFVFLATRFTSIPGPIPPGYVNFGDAVIMVTALLLGGRSGLLAGALGSALADVAYGAYIYVPITFIVKGIEGYVIGAIASKSGPKGAGYLRKAASLVIGAIIMVAGYFLSEAFILGYINNELGLGAAVTSLPGNLVQGGVSVILGYSLTVMLLRAKIQRYL